MKLPERIYENAYIKEKIEYVVGWNTTITTINWFFNYFTNEDAINNLLALKSAYKKTTTLEFKGAYDCILEFERLNEMTEGEQNA